MTAQLERAGFSIADTLDEADCAIVNTCSFIASATEESIDEIFDILNESTARSSDIPVIVSGCMPARYGEELMNEIPEVAAFLPCKDEGKVVSVVCDALGLEMLPDESLERNGGQSCETNVFAYVKISDGCDRFCSYCTIPFIRGPYHSFSFDDICADVDRNVSSGVREIVLIAQDTGRWGEDFDEPATLADLVSRLAVLYPETWFRIMYIEPEGVSDALIDAIASHDNICNYLDIPIQHVDEKILSDMNRRGSRSSITALVTRIRERIPDITLRTTLIVGFPGESAEQFQELEDFISEGFFDLIGIFPFSQEEGTRAAKLPDQIDEDEKIWRANQLRSVADAVSAAHVAETIGHTVSVLIEGSEEDGQLFGRSQAQAPEVDGVTFVDNGTKGDVVPTLIEDTLLYDMEGSVIVEGDA